MPCRPPFVFVFALLFVAGGAHPGKGRAQWRRPTTSVALPPTALVAPDDAFAVTVDASALSLLRSWSLGYVHADALPGSALESRGDAIYGASPLLFGFALGAGVESVRPTQAALALSAPEHTMLSLGLSWAYDERIAIGATSRVLWSANDPGLSNLFSLDLSASWRVNPAIAWSFIARDVTGPSYGAGRVVPRSFLLALGIRPCSDRSVTVEVAGAADDTGRLGARGLAEVELPYIGRLQGMLEVSELGSPNALDLRGTAGLAVDWDHVGAGAGAIFGDRFDEGPGFYVAARVDGYARPGIRAGAKVADIVLNGQSSRTLLWTLRRLERALVDPEIQGVVLRLHGSGLTLASAQEIREMIEELARAGKPSVCHLSDASGAELYACAGARTVMMDPAGGLRLYGPGLEIMHFAGLMQSLGVRADFVRIGDYKAAIEEFQDSQMSAPAREARETNLDDLHTRMTEDLAADLGMTREEVGALIDQGPYLPRTAQERRMIDVLADEQDMNDELEVAFGRSVTREYREPTEVNRVWGRATHVGVVVVDGDMIDGTNLDIPLLEIHATGGRTATDAIERMASDPSVAAIVLRIDSPGGSVLAADQIWRAVRRARRRKPVIASMGTIAASAGYYIASACQEIWAEPSTLTGSIGVWFGKVDFQPLAERFGVHTEFLTRGRHAGVESLWRPFTPEERGVLIDLVRDWYRTFLSRVAEGRGLSMREIDAVARGRVWTGQRAHELHLIDHLGGFRDALVRARNLGGLPHWADFEVQPSRPSSLFDYVLGENPLGSGDVPAGEARTLDLGGVFSELAPEVQRALRAVWIMRMNEGSGVPLARMPTDVVH